MSRAIKIAAVAAFLLFIGGGVVWYTMHVEKPQDLEVQILHAGLGAPVKVYAAALDDDADPNSFISDKYLAATVEQSTTLTLKKGKYVVVSSASSDYNSQTSTVTLAEQPEKVVIDPQYNTKKLGDLLNENLATIKQVITQKLSPSIASYEIRPGKLYENGEWYATTVIPKLSEEERRLNYTDTYRIVLRKANSTWVVATLPELTLSHLVYPDIPKDILVDVNKQ